MKSTHWRVCALAALLPLSVVARAAQTDPTNAAVDVPAVQYDSVFKNYRPVVEESASPDKGWRTANDAVAAKPGEDHMTGMQTGGSMRAPVSGKTDAQTPAEKLMVMPDGTTMPMGDHKSMPRDRGMKMPMDKGMKMPMQTPKGNTPMPGMDMSHDQNRQGR